MLSRGSSQVSSRLLRASACWCLLFALQTCLCSESFWLTEQLSQLGFPGHCPGPLSPPWPRGWCVHTLRAALPEYGVISIWVCVLYRPGFWILTSLLWFWSAPLQPHPLDWLLHGCWLQAEVRHLPGTLGTRCLQALTLWTVFRQVPEQHFQLGRQLCADLLSAGDSHLSDVIL